MNKKFAALFFIIFTLTKSALPIPPLLEGFTHYHRAAWYSDVATINNLLVNGYSPDVQDEFGWTALHIAAAWGHFACVIALVQNGADIFLETNNNQTAEELAWQYRQLTPECHHEKIWFYLKTEREKYERQANKIELAKIRDMQRAEKKEFKRMRKYQKDLEKTFATEAMDCE
ncbi:ankyrin repeat domain-containing protein [bacterium]|nr:MAG: ankyrin repeat domain-containing protein [bacterium]